MEDNWEFYPCRVDNAPASILVNLALLEQLEQLSEDTLYVLQIDMRNEDQHGMGDSVEAATLYPAEDALVKELDPVFRYVGRLRNLGVWQVVFMGPAGLETDLQNSAKKHLSPLPRNFATMCQSDPDWEYYRDFLYPEDERMRWIEDRHVVDALKRHGDTLTQKRRVDHWLYFPDSKSQAAFIAELVTLGFELVEPTKDSTEFGVQAHRVDSVQLDEIHEVTIGLQELAATFDGEYDGWETSVEAGN